MIIHYKVPELRDDDIHSFELGYEACLGRDIELRNIASSCAENFMYNSGSDLADPKEWPITFVICEPEGKEISTMKVDIEYIPSFEFAGYGNV